MASLKAWVPWFQALAWIATGGAELVPEDVHPAVRWPPRLGPNDSVYLPYAPLVRHVTVAEELLLEALAAGEIICFGIPGCQAASPPEGEPVPIPREAWGFATGADRGIRAVFFRDGLVPFLRLSAERCWWRPAIRREDILGRWPFVPQTSIIGLSSAKADSRKAPEAEAPVRNSADTPVTPTMGNPVTTTTIASEKRLVGWLVQRMRNAPDDPPGKEKIKLEARQAGHVVSSRAFNRAYAAAVKEAGAPAYSTPGRKSAR